MRALVLLAALGTAVANRRCSGTISNSRVNSDVEVDGTCTLTNTVITGGIKMQSGGVLVTVADVEVFGSIEAGGGAELQLSGVVVSGGLTAQDTGSITVGAGAQLNSITVSNGGDLTFNPGSAVGATSVLGGTGTITLCSASLLGLSVSERSTAGGAPLLTTPSGSAACPVSSQIMGTVSVEKSSGALDLTSAAIATGDVIVKEHDGDVSIANSIVSDVEITKLVGGDVSLDSVVTDSDVGITDNPSSTISISNGNFQGDLEVKGNGAVTIVNTNFNLEDVALSNNDAVVLEGNVQLGVEVTEVDSVVATGNTFEGAKFSKLSSLSFSGNSVGVLDCADIASVTGSDNDVTGEAKGPCASLA